MRYPLILLLLLATVLPACQSAPQSTTAISAMSAGQQRIADAVAQWPEVPASAPPLKRPFFATIHIVGRRTTASGLLQFHNARDFRITAATEMGTILFDGRMNWAGVNVMRSLPGVGESNIATLLRDLATAFQKPTTLTGGATKGTDYIVHQTGADTNHYTFTFDSRSGRLKNTQVDMGLFDTLRIDFLKYNGAGWPQEMTVTRKARFYTINLTFTDDAVAQRAASGNHS